MQHQLPSRPSTIRPSRRTMTRSARAAISGLWVARTRVVFSSRCSPASRSTMPRLLSESRLPVGSSAKTSSAGCIRGPTDRHPLLLAAGQLLRIIVPPLPQADPPQQRLGLGRGLPVAAQFRREHDILDGGQRRHEMEGLEDEAGLDIADRRQFVLAQPGDIAAGQQDRPRSRPIQAREEAEQGRLAAAGRTGDDDERPGLDLQADPLEDMFPPLADSVYFLQLPWSR